VKAFIDRTLKRIKTAAKAAKRGGGNQFFSLMSGATGGRDIDRIAMELNLKWEQMDQMLPIFTKYDANAKALMKEMQESGGFGDKEAWKDLQEEMKLMRQDAEPEFAKFLDESQAKRALRYLGQGGGLPMLGDGGGLQIFGTPGGGSGAIGIIRRGGENPDK
jgi:hypothetical protein